MSVNFWGPEQRANTNISGNQHQSSLAALKDGGFVAIWTEVDRDFDVGGETDSGIYLQIHNASGEQVGTNVMVNYGLTSEPQGNPPVVVLEDGSISVARHLARGAAPADDAILFTQLSANGERLLESPRVLSTGSNTFSDPSVVARADGGFTILVEANEVSMSQAYHFDASLQAVGQPTTLSYSLPFDEPAMAQLANGGSVIVVDADEHVLVRIDDRKGADSMHRGNGNDVYIVDNINDRVPEAAGAGTDVVRVKGSWILGADSKVERIAALKADSDKGVELQGSAIAQTLAGTRGADLLWGGGGLTCCWAGAETTPTLSTLKTVQLSRARRAGSTGYVRWTRFG